MNELFMSYKFFLISTNQLLALYYSASYGCVNSQLPFVVIDQIGVQYD